MDKQYAGIGSGGLNNSVLSQKPPQPALSSLYEAMKIMREATGMTRNVADQLCGTQPEALGEVSEAATSFFGQIEDISSEIRAIAVRIMSDMNRVQNRL